MDVFDAAPEPGTAQRGPVCVFLTPESRDRLGAAARALGADPALAAQLPAQPHRRPLAHVEGKRISVVAFATNDLDRVAEVQLHVGERGLLVMCPVEAAAPLRAAVGDVDGAPEDALAAVLLALARLAEDAVQRLTEQALLLDAASAGLASGAQRRDMSRARSQLFALQQLWTAHRQVMSGDDQLVDVLTDGAQRTLRRARGIFDTCGTAAAQLYALLGDTLNRQATVINERLTLVAVIFFPLTVSTGFFGMNFAWMTDNIGSPGAFIVLGLVLPVLLVCATLLGARWLTRA